jgi:dTDP-4-amino-4,6-dideoxygalactose transaminase
MQVPLLDLRPQFDPLRTEIFAALERVAESQHFILGAEVTELEASVAKYCRAGAAVGVSSGTDALLAILMAMEIGEGDAVITTPYTFFATAGGLARLGARAVFIDIDPGSFNLSPEKLRAYLEKNCRRDAGGSLLSHRGEKIRAIMPVHLFGLSCEMDAIRALAAEYSLSIIEDAAQALGTEYPSAELGIQFCGAMGEAGLFSFFPSKNLGAFGDAGMVVCRDEAMAAKIRLVRNHGMEDRYFHRIVGGNFRLDAIQAAVLNVKLPHLDEWSASRRANAAVYREEFAAANGLIVLPVDPFAGRGATNHHIYNQFVVRVPRRDELCRHLTQRGIGHAIYYPLPLHLQECFRDLGYREGDFPEAEAAARESIALPIYPGITRDMQQYVARSVMECIKV